jgi:Xaa-Pro aminopeptidase
MSGPEDEPFAASLVSACRSRQQRLGDAMDLLGLDALMIAHPRDIRYLTGFSGEDTLLVVPGASGQAAVIITDARHDELLDPWRASGIAEVVMGTRHRLEQSVPGLCASRHVGRLGIQAEHLTLAGRGKLGAALSAVGLVETEGLVGRLRMRKDEVEIAAIERAAAVHQEAMRAALNGLSIGMTELELCAAIEYEMKIRGASGPSFDTMVATGPRSSTIHHVTGPARIEPGTLLVDWGAVVDGYCSDMTRTFGVGSMPKNVREIYEIVLEAQLSAIDACGPGKSCAEIDAVARGIIERAGYGKYFGHGLGHGLGLDIHEEPYFNELQNEVVLEPGIYLPGVGGVRLEDDVLITAGGCRVLTDYPKDPDSAVIDAASTRPGRVGDACHA